MEGKRERGMREDGKGERQELREGKFKLDNLRKEGNIGRRNTEK